jgi:quercetin dioxygenase-like cupin family protein
MEVINTEELPLLSLPLHYKSFNKKVIGVDIGAKKIEVMLGIAESGGGAEMHYHPESEHVMYMLEGVLRVRDEKGAEVELKKGMAIYIPPGELHQPYNPSSDKAVYLVINSPPATVRTR